MIDQSNETDTSLSGQIKTVLHDAIDYLGAVLNLVQARCVELALSSFAFIGLFAFAVLFLLAALIILNVAFGIWLANATGSAGWAMLILGGIYFAAAAIAGFICLRWLRRLQS